MASLLNALLFDYSFANQYLLFKSSLVATCDLLGVAKKEVELMVVSVQDSKGMVKRERKRRKRRGKRKYQPLSFVGDRKQ